MPAEVFFDTSVLLYLVSADDPRSEVSEVVLQAGGVVSVQVLNEFVNVARRKYGMDWAEIDLALLGIRRFCHAVAPLTVSTHDAGMYLAQRYGYRIYDAMLLAAAIEAGCTILYSEDMQDGQKIGPLTIRNPFLN